MNKIKYFFTNILIHIILPLDVGFNVATILKTNAGLFSYLGVSTITLIILYLLIVYDGYKTHIMIDMIEASYISFMKLLEEYHKDNLTNLIEMKTELLAVKKLDEKLLYTELDCIIKILDNKINFRKAEINENFIIETKSNKN